MVLYKVRYRNTFATPDVVLLVMHLAVDNCSDQINLSEGQLNSFRCIPLLVMHALANLTVVGPIVDKILR